MEVPSNIEEVPIEDIFNLYEEPIQRFRLSEGALIYDVETNSMNSKVTVSYNGKYKEIITEAIIKPDIEIEGKKYTVNYIGICGFKDCIKLRKVEIPEGILKIHAAAFADCISLEEVYLPFSMKYIGFGAFNSCKKLRKVSLPSTCEINGNPFIDCPTNLIIEKR